MTSEASGNVSKRCPPFSEFYREKARLEVFEGSFCARTKF